MKIGTQYIFPTPIWRTNIIPELEKHNITIEDLINQCLEMKAKDQGRIVSNIGKTSYQGNNFFFIVNIALRLTSFIQNNLLQVNINN